MGCGCWPKRSGRKRSRLRKFFRRKKKDVNVSEAAAIPDQGTLPVPAQEPLAPEPLAQEPLAQEPLVQEPPVQEAVLSQTQAVIPEVKPRMDVAVYVSFVLLTVTFVKILDPMEKSYEYYLQYV